ncbi:Rpn family recombination-promoting nuclease/putative transposase [Rhodoflexus caldus]|uniref:Rpn family recombination-promoting nuclease/putative transposase n=1 Tax=Rhodoflexus caldus TaxID=2891236 RepID=UPI002029F601|nr:Rpn family recombination-promoting nuclease/putative transposase [Rhodoflexus caldus]
MARYLNPFTDFGFKKLFGNEQNKELLISFLNQILPDNQISVINYLRTEHLGQTDLDRKVIYDLYCENERGEKFIVELQKAKQSFFKDRTLFYATFPIQEQAQQGDWNYELKAVYTVAVLDFCFDDEDRDKVKVQVKLMDTEQKTVFYDKLTFVYLQMPNFRKTEEELETLEDKWFYLLRHLAELQNRPQRLQDKVFDRLFEAAEIARFNPEEREAYEDSLKYYRDVKNSLDTAREEGLQEGIKIVALRMLAKGFTPAEISEVTGLTASEIQKLGKQ